MLIMLESVSPDVAGSLLHASECIVAVCTRVQLRDQISQHPALARTHARSHARTLARSHARTHALSCMHTCMHERTHAHDPRTLPTHIPTQRTHTSRALLRAINSDGSDRQLRGMLPLMTSRTVDSGCRVAHYARTRRQRDRGRRRVLLRGPPRRQQRRAPARQLHRRARKMNDCVRDEIWVTVPVTGTKGICSQCRALRVVFIDVPKSTLRTTSRLNAVLGR